MTCAPRSILFCLIVTLVVASAASAASAAAAGPQDEAKLADRTVESFPPADEDYFKAMDNGAALTPAEIKGRNMWLVWTGGNVLTSKRSSWRSLLRCFADPNDIDAIRASAEGLRYTPLTTCNHRRGGARERVLAVARQHPDRLVIELDALAAKVLLDQQNRAIGVEYLKGKNLYRAHGRPSEAAGEQCQARATREVILAGGAFNTPQLLMLSGIGPRDALQRFGITPRVDLSGVGRNLQDRYEVCVLNRMNFEQWESLAGARFAKGDPLYQAWQAGRDSLYNTCGAGLGVLRRSTPERALPDLFCMPFLAPFAGYYPGYAAAIKGKLNYLSWSILKAHTENRAGEVTLRSADPRDPPNVSFHYFEEGSDGADQDLAAVIAGIRFARRITEQLKDDGLIEEEELPGVALQSDEELGAFVRTNAWGHHASCSCAIGSREANGVLDSAFRVHGVTGLRVVDASVFPRIPGFFVATAIYMIGEKAADVILADADADAESHADEPG